MNLMQKPKNNDSNTRIKLTVKNHDSNKKSVE